MFESIYCSYPFCKDWEKEMCKKVLTDAREWGEKIDKQEMKKKLGEKIKMFKFYNG